ncbi:MAG TPA: hypothetical protein VGG39_03015 [Polyangiaceae bacterium]
MRSNLVKLVCRAGTIVIVGTLPSCGGQEVLALGGDAGGGDGGSPSGDVDAAFVLGSAIPCGEGICSPPDVCCQSDEAPTLPGAITCEAESLCHDVAIACTATTCPAGSVCCAVVSLASNGNPTGWASCVEGGTCPPGGQIVCALAVFGATGQGIGCPANEVCYGRGPGYATCEPPPSDAGED